MSTGSLDRLPPQSLEAEQGVLGSMLLQQDCIHDIVELLTPDCFFKDSHRKIYEVILHLYADGKTVDPLIVREELKRRGYLEPVGQGELTTEYLGRLLEAVPTAAHAHYYARIVREKAIARKLIEAATQIVRQAYDPTTDADELLQEAERAIFDIAQARLVGETLRLADVLAEAFNRIDDRAGRAGQLLSGLPTGFYDLDELTSGLQNSELIVIAARPSVGKTALAMNILEHVCVDEGIGALLVSLEQSRLELAERLLCSRARLDSHRLRSGRIGSSDIARLQQAADEMRGAPLFIDDTPGRNMLQIAAIARRLRRQHQIQLVVVDYLQLIEPDNPRDSRQEQIAKISRRLKMMARDLQIPVIALSQLNRSLELREGHRPRLADLRESGSIEQDADVVMLLHRPELYEEDAEPGLAEVIVAKQRNGPTGTVRLTFLKQYTRFENYHPLPQVAPEVSQPIDLPPF
jgi:replicative DNA helicase